MTHLVYVIEYKYKYAKVIKNDKDLPSNKSLSSRRASLLSRRSCRSISWLIRFCSLASSERQHSILKPVLFAAANFLFCILCGVCT